jgi:hypothetical protein
MKNSGFSFLLIITLLMACGGQEKKNKSEKNLAADISLKLKIISSRFSIDILAFIGGSNAADNLLKDHPSPHPDLRSFADICAICVESFLERE